MQHKWKLRWVRVWIVAALLLAVAWALLLRPGSRGTHGVSLEHVRLAYTQAKHVHVPALGAPPASSEKQTSPTAGGQKASAGPDLNPRRGADPDPAQPPRLNPSGLEPISTVSAEEKPIDVSKISSPSRQVEREAGGEQVPVEENETALPPGFSAEEARQHPALAEWDPRELELLTSAQPQTTDVLGVMPEGTVVIPEKRLTFEELLAANRSQRQINYVGAPQLGPGALTLRGRRRDGKPLTPASAPAAGVLPPGQIQLESSEYLDYDDERKIIYGHGRITARYGLYRLEADQVLIDTRLREIQAFGNVVLASDTDYLEAESLWVDTKTNEGIVRQTRGRTGEMFTLADPEVNDGRFTLRQLSSQEALVKEGSVTMCDFPVPHYRLHAKEFTIFYNDRVFARNVVLYIRECPVLWLPYFTRGLNESNPWGATIGSDQSLGFFLRVWYDYHHSCYTPSDFDESLMIRSTYGRARLRTDIFSKRGFGKGLDYSYYIENGLHRGELFAYQIDDKERDVKGDEEESRSYINWYNRTKLSQDLNWLVDVDYPSDPDIFFDIFDRVRGQGERRRQRLPERRIQTAFEYTVDDWFAGLQVELKDRIGRDRVSNFQDPRDSDFDFDRRFNDEEFFTLDQPGWGPPGAAPGEQFFYPNAGTYTDPRSVEGTLDNGLAVSRYGRVTERLPQLTVSSNRQRLYCLPLWYHFDFNAFNNLDKGLNVVGTEDDSYVPGFDLYQSLSHLLKFCERYTLLTKVGLGVGAAQRLEDSYNLDFPDGAKFPFIYDGQLINGVPEGLTFVDEDTFLVGRRRVSLSQVDPFFAYGDIDSRFNARISDSLTAWVRYRFRDGNESLGEFYESIGSRKTKDDLYPFRTREHWLEAGLTYNLLYPRLNANFSAGKNLQGEGEIYPYELRQYTNVGVAWANLKNTLLINSGVSLQERQMRDPTDPNEYLQDTLTYYVAGSYLPVHQRYYTRLAAYLIQNLNNDPLGAAPEDRDLNNDNEEIVRWSVGRKIGTKYLVEYNTVYRSREEGLTDSFVRVERDFHDMIAGLAFGFKGTTLSREEESTKQDNFQVRLNFRFKPASEKGVLPVTRASDLYQTSKLGAFETSNAIESECH